MRIGYYHTKEDSTVYYTVRRDATLVVGPLFTDMDKAFTYAFNRSKELPLVAYEVLRNEEVIATLFDGNVSTPSTFGQVEVAEQPMAMGGQGL